MSSRCGPRPVAPRSRRNFVVDALPQCRVHKINDNEGSKFELLKWDGHEIYYTEAAVDQAIRQLPREQQDLAQARRPSPDPNTQPIVRA